MSVAGRADLTPEELAERRRQVVELRRSGVSWWNIGDKLGISDTQAWRDFHGEMERLSAMDESVYEARRMEIQRLDKLLETFMPKAEAGNPEAGEFCLKIANRRARLLGLDEPTRREVDVLDARQRAKQLTVEQAVARLAVLQEKLQIQRKLPPGTEIIEADSVAEPVMALPSDGVKD